MRKVIDSNYLRTKELRDYLATSRENKVVITDYLKMEMLKGGGAAGMLKSIEIIAQYPKQVVVAKTTDIAASLRGKRKGLKKRLTDKRRTRAFRKWCRRRNQIQTGDQAFDEQREQAVLEAGAHLDRLLENGRGLKDDLAAHVAQHYMAEELHLLRTGQTWTPELHGKVLDAVMDFALKFFAANPEWRELPSAADLPYTFTFRFALCAYLHALHWIAAGGARHRKPEDFRNDLVDIAIVAFATCFDGLLSNDKLANEIYENAVFLLKDGFLRKELQPDRKRVE